MIKFKSNIYISNYLKIYFSRELFDNEHKLLNHLHHPNLVQFYGYTIKQNYALIEHSDLGDLYTHLLTSKNIS